MDGRCATCKWWIEEVDDENYWYSSLPQGERRRCALANRWDKPDHPESKAIAMNTEDSAAFLFTMPDFGCVQWEGAEGTS